MVKNLPDKYIRNAVFSAINGIFVDSEVINCYATRVTGLQKHNYTLMSMKTYEVNKRNKCSND